MLDHLCRRGQLALENVVVAPIAAIAWRRQNPPIAHELARGQLAIRLIRLASNHSEVLGLRIDIHVETGRRGPPPDTPGWGRCGSPRKTAGAPFSISSVRQLLRQRCDARGFPRSTIEVIAREKAAPAFEWLLRRRRDGARAPFSLGDDLWPRRAQGCRGPVAMCASSQRAQRR